MVGMTVLYDGRWWRVLDVQQTATTDPPQVKHTYLLLIPIVSAPPAEPTDAAWVPLGLVQGTPRKGDDPWPLS